MDSPLSTPEAGKNIYVFVFISSLISFGVCIYVVFLWCSEKSSFKQKLSTSVNKKKTTGAWKEYIP